MKDRPLVAKAINENVREQLKDNNPALTALSFSKIVNIFFVLEQKSLQGGLLTKIETILDDPEAHKPIGAIVKLMEKIQFNDFSSISFENYLVKVCRGLLNEESNFAEHSVPVKARLLKIMTKLKVTNQTQKVDEVITALATELSSNLSLLDEKSVLVLLEGISNMKYTAPYTGGKCFKPIKELNQQLNNFVIKMAEQQPELVNVKFLIHYLARLQSFTNNVEFRVSWNQLQPIIKMTDAKLTDPTLQGFGRLRIDDLFIVGEQWGNEMPNLTKIAFDRFLTPNSFSKGMTDHLGQVIEMTHKSNKSSEEKQELFEQIIERIEG